MIHKKIILELKERKFFEHIPVDLEKIAKFYDIIVEREFMSNLSGKIKTIKNQYIIFLNMLHPHTRQRFTLAHELAHFFLHEEHIGDGIQDDPLYKSEQLPNEMEVEANKLASQIIMPEDKIQERAQDYLDRGHSFNERLAENLATEFQVSPIAMKIRIGL